MTRQQALGASLVLLVAACAGQGPPPVPTQPPSPVASPAVLPSATLAASPAPTVSATQATDMIDIGGRSIHLSCVGESTPGEPTVVFENGLGGTATSWSSIRRAVSATVRACAYDRAGMGRSDPAGSEARTAQDLADDLEALLDRAEIQPPYVFVSHSLGPWVTTLFTAARPDTVAGLVLVDPRGPDVSAGWAAGLPPPTVGESEALTGKRDYITAFEADPSANPEGLAMPASELEVRAALGTAVPPFGAIPVIVLQAGLTPDQWSDLPEPARAAWDRAWLDGQTALASASTAGRVDVLPDSSHDVQGDAPSSVIDAILEVLAAAR